VEQFLTGEGGVITGGAAQIVTVNALSLHQARAASISSRYLYRAQ
jgi:hypothetical protein